MAKKKTNQKSARKRAPEVDSAALDEADGVRVGEEPVPHDDQHREFHKTMRTRFGDMSKNALTNWRES